MPAGSRPSSLLCEGRNCFWLFSRSFPARCALFLLTSAVFSRLDAEFPWRCAGFSVRRGCASLALMQVFATSCGALGASRSAFAVGRPAARAAFIASPPFITRWWKKRADFPLIHNLFSTVFSTVWRKCPPSRVFLPAFPFFLRRAHRSPSRRGEEKSPSRARIYNIGAEKGEKGSAPFAAFRGGRGLLGARGGERWFRPVGKGLTVGWGAQKGVGECVGGGLPGAPVGVGRVKVVGRARSVCTRVATVGGEQGCHGRCACTIRAQF